MPLNSIVKLEKEYHCTVEARVSNPVLEAQGTALTGCRRQIYSDLCKTFQAEEGSFTLMQYPSLNGFVKTRFLLVSDLYLVEQKHKYRDCLNPSCFYSNTCAGPYS